MDKEEQASEVKEQGREATEARYDPMKARRGRPPRKKRTPRSESGLPGDMDEKKASSDLRVITKMMKERGMNIEELYNRVSAYVQFIAAENPKYQSEFITYGSFVKMLSGKRSLPSDFFVKLIGMMNYQMIIVPQETRVILKGPDDEAEIPPDEKKDSIKLYRREVEYKTEIDKDAVLRIVERVTLKKDYIDLPREIKLRVKSLPEAKENAGGSSEISAKEDGKEETN